MIVTVNLSIPNDGFDEANYLVSALVRLARPDYPGYVKFTNPGLRGKIKRSSQERRNPDGSEQLDELQLVSEPIKSIVTSRRLKRRSSDKS